MSSQTDEKDILIEDQGDGIYVIKLNRPKVLNALHTKMLENLAKAFNSLEGKAKVVILTGSGRAFSAGIDLTSAIKVFQGEFKPTKDTGKYKDYCLIM
jgi:enoyl-CoA hydratase/carnithine racemase